MSFFNVEDFRERVPVGTHEARLSNIDMKEDMSGNEQVWYTFEFKDYKPYTLRQTIGGKTKDTQKAFVKKICGKVFSSIGLMDKFCDLTKTQESYDEFVNNSYDTFRAMNNQLKSKEYKCKLTFTEEEKEIIEKDLITQTETLKKIKFPTLNVINPDFVQKF